MFEKIIIFLSILGLFIAGYIGYKKKKQEKLKCIVGNNCDIVTHSKYSKMFGVPLEYFGMLYYLVIITLALFLIYEQIELFNISIEALIIGFSVFATIFSVYLIYIQLIVLKNTCDYCLANAGISFLILLFELL